MEDLSNRKNDGLCRSVSFKELELHMKILDETGELVAARNTKLDFNLKDLLHKEVRTDFPLTDEKGKKSWYEEFPTRTDPYTGKSVDYFVDIYRYDPNKDSRGEQLDKGSAEYAAAHEELWKIRSIYTPNVVLELPTCRKGMDLRNNESELPHFCGTAVAWFRILRSGYTEYRTNGG